MDPWLYLWSMESGGVVFATWEDGVGLIWAGPEALRPVRFDDFGRWHHAAVYAADPATLRITRREP